MATTMTFTKYKYQGADVTFFFYVLSIVTFTKYPGADV
jgi:hypothetical protein